MTLIVGIRCADGIVVGADGAATLGSMGQQTAQQKTVKKLSILQGKIIVGVSGSVGMGQRLRAALDDGYKQNKFKGRPEVAMGVMRGTFWNEIAAQEWQIAAQVGRAIGPQLATGYANSAMLIAVPLEHKAELIQFDHQCSPELATDELPFVAIGSGQALADPFLSLIRKVFWPTELPPINEGIFSAVWTLRHAIDTNPGGIADPVQVAVLERKKDWSARELSRAEILQHEEAVTDAGKALADWRSQFTANPTGAPPEEPPS